MATAGGEPIQGQPRRRGRQSEKKWPDMTPFSGGSESRSPSWNEEGDERIEERHQREDRTKCGQAGQSNRFTLHCGGLGMSSTVKVLVALAGIVWRA